MPTQRFPMGWDDMFFLRGGKREKLGVSYHGNLRDNGG